MSKAQGRVCVVGSVNMDAVIRVPRFPRSGETILGGPFQLVPGGKGANQAVAAAKLGSRVSLVARVGDDAFGAQLVAGLKGYGVDISQVKVTPGLATGMAVVMVERSGLNAIAVASGANQTLSPEDVQEAREVIATSGVVLAQLEVALETVARAAALARASGVTVILNPAPAQPLPQQLLRHTSIIVPNEVEAEALTGISAQSVSGAERAGKQLLQMGPQTVIITLGEKGALLLQKGEARYFPAHPVEPVDTTACGDAFCGALAASLASSCSIEEAVLRANAAGALTATRVGAQPSLPSLEMLEEFLVARGSPEPANKVKSPDERASRERQERR